MNDLVKKPATIGQIQKCVEKWKRHFSEHLKQREVYTDVVTNIKVK
jgi:hypothetical protein